MEQKINEREAQQQRQGGNGVGMAKMEEKIDKMRPFANQESGKLEKEKEEEATTTEGMKVNGKSEKA
ncbi:conserved hypothetical protein [Ricinus communis]|uniref:Uncharacterized protein n=1 Tax=Ricinus communis TaxID=3988 RepID=B9RRL0_RICCO|nr:conserved hypothetical protein [Ricinus communis]